MSFNSQVYKLYRIKRRVGEESLYSFSLPHEEIQRHVLLKSDLEEKPSYIKTQNQKLPIFQRIGSSHCSLGNNLKLQLDQLFFKRQSPKNHDNLIRTSKFDRLQIQNPTPTLQRFRESTIQSIRLSNFEKEIKKKQKENKTMLKNLKAYLNEKTIEIIDLESSNDLTNGNEIKTEKEWGNETENENENINQNKNENEIEIEGKENINQDLEYQYDYYWKIELSNFENQKQITEFSSFFDIDPIDSQWGYDEINEYGITETQERLYDENKYDSNSENDYRNEYPTSSEKSFNSNDSEDYNLYEDSDYLKSNDDYGQSYDDNDYSDDDFD
ncbi:RNA polymerase ii nuclear localization protein slc7a6os-related [Anaeramoeba flamelloides]|uniref:RNA polymerase ii nuclear localization protein slc7a6os-related n=1 Tax=Anaeramoeba flamelloides TaxID=1746091 RepID=A0AAV8A819_9EUKA|nr:RNA polymerase ii nuclear localization protein slc7a6os-related [Anaeramoeba flamelloides]